MVATNKATVFLTGKIYWAKIFGAPRMNYQGDGKEWTFEFEPNEAGIKVLKDHKLSDRLKDKYEDRGRFISLRQRETQQNGKPNKHIRVYNADQEGWDENVLLGNGSEVDVKLDIRDYGAGKKKGIYPAAIRVKELVAYQSSEFGAMDAPSAETAPKRGGKVPIQDSFEKDFLLEEDDEVPF